MGLSIENLRDNMLYRLLNKLGKLKTIRCRYLINRTFFKAGNGSTIVIGKNVRILKSRIDIADGSTLIIGDNTVLKNVVLRINGSVEFGSFNLIGGAIIPTNFILDSGNLQVGNFNRLKCKVLIRFGGKICIGNRNNINDDSEIRCDESVAIGDYNQVSYSCIIWDTNTHNIYPDAFRRNLTNKHYPVFGFEFEKPKTKPVIIGSDCWIGYSVSILKGSVISDSVVVGYNTTISNQQIESNSVVVTNVDNRVFQRTDEKVFQ